MIVRKLHYSVLAGSYELFRELPDDIDADVVMVKMSTDLPYQVDPNQEVKPTWLYEAGNIVNGKFDAELVWYSENGSLFD